MTGERIRLYGPLPCGCAMSSRAVDDDTLELSLHCCSRVHEADLEAAAVKLARAEGIELVSRNIRERRHR